MAERRVEGHPNLKPAPEFEPGNQVARRHGAQALVSLRPRAAELVEALRPRVPGYTEADEVPLALLGLVLARLEAAADWIDEHGLIAPGKRHEVHPVVKLIGGWERQAQALARDLGMGPAARGALGADVATARSGAALADYLRARYGGDGEVVE